MKSRSNILVSNLCFVVLFVILISLFLLPSKSRASSEISGCKIAQQNLGASIRSNDLRTRVNRMQAYQYMYQKLDIFVQRLENNGQPGAKDLRAKTDELGTQITKFRDDYEAYDKDRDKVTKIENCTKNSIAFDRALQNARNSRAVVHEDVVNLDEMLSGPIQNSIRNLYTELLASSPAGVSNE
ncbi:hypothetical protein H6800_01470 [Candidatus Nomurabacteria bacterium]|nr:hypothetical protein [Candidatus Nomurabacteria bacterium]